MDRLKSRGWVRVIAVGAISAASACVPIAIEPAVSSFNEASVGVQLPDMSFVPPNQQAEAIAKADAKAAEICRRGPNRKAEFTSSRVIPTGQYTSVTERIYLCLK